MDRGRRRPFRRGHSGFRNMNARMNSESPSIRTFSKGEEVSNRREYNTQRNYPNRDRFLISNNNRMDDFACAQDKFLPSNVTVSSDCPESEYMPYNYFKPRPNKSAYDLDACSEAISAHNENLDDNPVKGRESSTLDSIAKFQKQLEKTEPYTLILECRNRIDDMAKKSIKKNQKAIETLIKKKNADNKQIFQTQKENFYLQRNEFESYITEVKQQLSSLSTLDVLKIIPKAENLIKEVELECNIFNGNLPGYSLKSKIISKLKDNQITIINSDSIYYFDVILPIFLSKQYANYKILCCETNKIQCCSLTKNISVLYPYYKESYIEVFSANEMLEFVTKNVLLNKSEKDFIVICKLPLRRSIILDLLLVYLKDVLKVQSKCRLILLLSTYDKSLKYEQYFSKFNVGLIKTPVLSFPVATKWRNEPLLPTDDYNDEVVKIVISIHSLKDSDGGDIMVFFPTISDAKKALANLKIKLCELKISNIECIMLHEYSPNSNWIDMSFVKKSNTRTVFFVNDSAELFIIRSVRYIVDSGLKKEHVYDTTKKIDVLTTAFISRDKATLREKMAGYFLDGICYRLYNKDNFSNEMPASECPEILSINPFNAMLKLFQYQPNNAMNIDLIESISEDIKTRTLILLEKSNAVKDNKLTPLGQQMIKLNLPPLYAKLILVGIEWELSYETVILVAFFSVKGRLFQFFSDAKEQKRVDASKLQLIEAESDTISYIRIYKLWLENNENSSWCLQYNINEDTLKLVHAKVIELCKLIGEKIKQNVPLVFNKTKEATNLLVELLFECFERNLCVFTGHYKSGYRVLSSRCVSFIHPSSMISITEKPPQFIIFDHMHSTKRDFLVHITSIPTDMIMNALTKQTLNFDYSDMFENTLREEIIEPVSEKIINQVFLGKKGHKLKEIEKEIHVNLADESIVVEPSAEKRQISVFASRDHIADAVKCVNDILKRELEIISNSENIQVLELKKGSTTIPIEIGWLKGGKVNKLKAISQTNPGSTNNINQDSESNDVPYAIRQCINVTWTRRKCTGRASVKFSKALFSYARRFAMRSIPLLGVEVFITSDDRTSSLILSGIPHLATANEIENNLIKIIQADISFERIELEYEPPMETSENHLQEIKKLLENACHEHTELVDFNIIVPKPKNTATVMKAFINVSKDENIKIAAENLSKSLNNFPCTIVRPVYSSIIKCSVKICKALESCFQEKLIELEAMVKDNFSEEDPFKFTIVKDNEELSSIKMLSNCLEILEALQRTIYSLFDGDLLNKSFSKDIGKLFCRGGYLWFKTLEETDCCIIPNSKNKTIRLYGPKYKLHNIKQRILQFLLDSESEVVKTIPLYTDTNNKILLKTLLIEYGVHLENFIVLCGLRSAELSIKTCTLSIHGNRDSIEKAENLLKDLASKIDFDSFSEILEDGEYCPVCACPALNLTHRLELCGHLYCCECMEGLVEQAQFPIQCCYEDCNEDLLLDDINKILGDDPERINNLLEKSMKKFLEEHQNDYFYCPAPDCSMFFNKNEVPASKHQCPLCLNEICKSCNVVYHQGYSCEMYQGSKNDPDYSFKVWQKNSTECKQCPKCKTAIQKNGGCDHMTCKSCQSHFCWICVQEFPNARAVYEHIPYCAHHPKW